MYQTREQDGGMFPQCPTLKAGTDLIGLGQDYLLEAEGKH